MEKRALLAVVLSMLLLIFYSIVSPPSPPQKGKGGQDVRRAGKMQQEEPPSGSLEVSPPAGELPKFATEGGEAKEIVVDTDLFKMVLTSRGALIRALYLKKYTNKGGEPVNLVPADTIVHLPFYVEFSTPSLTLLANNAIYQADKEELGLSPSNPTDSLHFEYVDESGLTITKELTFYNDRYSVDAGVNVSDGPAGVEMTPIVVSWGDRINIGDAGKGRYNYEKLVTLVGDRRLEDKPKKVEQELKHSGDVLWTAIHNKYFVAALIPDDRGRASAVIRRVSRNSASLGLEFSDGRSGKHGFKFYLGPKESKRLETYNVDLERVINYGIFNFLAEPLLAALVFFHRVTSNWGVAIILLTVVVKVVFLPLTHKSFKSMQGMQALQPKIKLLQQRYKKDKQKLNEEMMALYREHKVNPLGGCLPLLLQMPVFFALYRVLYNSIELRHAPGLLWIKDLSDKDPVTTILMGLSMFMQQKMSPAMGDPRQAKMMLYMMPTVFTIMFFSFPSGLVLYWLVNNLLTIGQQYFILNPRKQSKPAKV